MNKLVLIILLLISQLTFAQDIDTSFIIKTPNSEIKVMCKKAYRNGTLSQSSLLLNAHIHIKQSTIDEAINSGIKKGKYYAKLNYSSDCNLLSIDSLKASDNISFNSEVDLYFSEFIEAYNSNDLKKYFRESDVECGTDRLIFSYYVE
ncbi:MAG: hypothetical protein MK105_13775 [Crocinitomicaceae bacterium]|nr:hypothetical protein [Crocinitomicaceae bacterium]